MAYTTTEERGNVSPILVRPDKIIKPPWAEIKYELEHNYSVSFQGAFTFFKTCQFITEENARSYKKANFIYYRPNALYVIEYFTTLFPYSEKGYDDAFRFAIANLDEDKIQLYELDLEYRRMRKNLIHRLDKVNQTYRKEGKKYASPEFLEYRQQVMDYARSLGTKKHIIDAVLRNEFDDVLYVNFKAQVHYMDSALDLYKGSIHPDPPQLDRKTNYNPEQRKRGQSSKKIKDKSVLTANLTPIDQLEVTKS